MCFANVNYRAAVVRPHSYMQLMLAFTPPYPENKYQLIKFCSYMISSFACTYYLVVHISSYMLSMLFWLLSRFPGAALRYHLLVVYLFIFWSGPSCSPKQTKWCRKMQEADGGPAEEAKRAAEARNQESAAPSPAIGLVSSSASSIDHSSDVCLFTNLFAWFAVCVLVFSFAFVSLLKSSR